MSGHSDGWHVEPLTEREQDVLHLLAQGKSNRELAEALVLSLNTVKWYARQVYAKLGVANRAEAVARARVMGLVAEAADSPKRPGLPLELTTFFGRQREIAALLRYLETARLVTITGPGGIGKTRLAVAVAHRAEADFADGAAFADLAPVEEAATAIPAIAHSLRFPLGGAGETRDAKTQLLDYLRGKELLLVLDNLEQHSGGAALASDLLQAAPGVNLLVTSRTRLQLPSEQLLPLRGLPVARWGAISEAADNPAVQLFLYHAQRLRPSFVLHPEDLEPLVQLCRLVGGMPLALILAASWIEVMSVGEIAREIANSLDFLRASYDGLPERHRSMRAVWRSTWQRLSPSERASFAALSVFRGGFTLPAAQSVAGVSAEELRQLVERSLLAPSEGSRFAVHELLRQFGAEQLQAVPSEATAARDRHTHYYLSVAEEIESQLLAPTQHEWLQRLEADHENIRIALDWASSRKDAETLARLSGALGVFWGIRGHLAEGEKWLATVLALRDQVSTPAIASVLFSLGWLAFERGDYATAKRYYQESHRLMVESGQTGRVAALLDSLSHVAQQQGDFAEATQLAEESLALYQSHDDRAGIAACLNRLGRLSELQGDLRHAAELLEQALALREEIGDQRGMASSLNSLAELARYQGDYRRAHRLYERSLALCTSLADKRCVAGLNHNLGHVALHMGNQPAAALHFRESLRLYHELDNPEGVALCLVGFARLHSASTKLGLAVLLLSAATRLMCQHNFVMTVADQATYEQFLSALRNRTGQETFARFWAEGQELTIAASIQRALSAHDAHSNR